MKRVKSHFAFDTVRVIESCRCHGAQTLIRYRQGCRCKRERDRLKKKNAGKKDKRIYYVHTYIHNTCTLRVHVHSTNRRPSAVIAVSCLKVAAARGTSSDKLIIRAATSENAAAGNSIIKTASGARHELPYGARRPPPPDDGPCRCITR